MATPADHNLLFGILALQMDFISRDALLAAMHAWVLQKNKPLGQLLVEQQALSGERHLLLEALVQEHLKQHGNNAEKSLAALSSLGSAQEALRQVADGEVQASLAHASAARLEQPTWATHAPFVGEATASGQRFRILRPHAKGGLGQVSVALDEELHREVALKEIQARHADKQECRSRFVLEAEITGGLEHPGIVPVYGLGQYSDGRPFYAMRFIKGDNLKDAIDRFHKADLPGRDPGERMLELRKLLGRFIDVCNAITYAHSRGVLHRDLKPGNIMLGKYGETLVVDWGLAKAVGRTEDIPRSEEPTLRPLSASGSAETVPGSMVGTPQYMSPEQAAGRVEQMGPSSDVYSLGATLFALLTGKAPFTDGDVGMVIQKVQRGDYPAPRQVKRLVPPALDAICRKAMALHPTSRYDSPRALADDIEHWLADEPMTAYPEPLGARLRRWGRRHKTLVAAGAVLLVTAVAGLSAGIFLLQQKQAEVVQERNTAQKMKDQAEALSKFYEDRVLVALRPKGWEGGMGKDVTLKEAVDLAAPKIDETFAGQPELEAKIRHTLGSTYWYLGQFDLAYPHLDKAYAIRLERLGPDHPDTLTSLDSLAMERWKQDKLAEAVKLGRQAVEKRQRVLGAEHQDTLWSQINLGLFLSELQGGWGADPEQLDEAETLLRQVIDTSKRTLGPDHHHTLYGQMCLYCVLGMKGKTEDSLALKRETLAARKRSLGLDHPDTLRSMCDLAWSLEEVGKLDEAETLCRQALEARRRVLGDAHVETFWGWYQLAFILVDQKKPKEAEELRRQTLKDCQRLRGPDDPDTLYYLTKQAYFLWDEGKLAEAEPLLRQALEGSRRKLGPEHSSTLYRQYLMAWLRNDQGKPAEAEELYRQTLEAQRRLHGPGHNSTLKTVNRLAALLADQGKNADAEALYREVLEICRRERGPVHAKTLSAQEKLAAFLADHGKKEEAEHHYGQLLASQRKLSPPDSPELATRLAVLGGLLADTGRPAEAEPLLQECLTIREKKLPAGHWQIATARSLLGGSLAGQKKLAEAAPLLLEGYTGLSRAAEAPAGLVARALDRIIALYEMWDKPEEAETWRKKRPPAQSGGK